MLKTIFPIYLDSSLSRNLVMQHCGAEFREGSRWHTEGAEYSHRVVILDMEGNCSFHTHYSDDNGFILSGGPVYDTVTKQVYDEDRMKRIVARRKVELAIEEHNRRETEKFAKEVLGIHSEMFGPMPEDLFQEILTGRY